MRNENEIKIINELQEISEVSSLFSDPEYTAKKSFGIGASNISFIGNENVQKFENILIILYNTKKEISQTWTLKTFESELVNLIRILKSENRKCLENDLVKLFSFFLEKELQESELLYELYGAISEKPTIEFGEFIVYNYDLAENIIKEKYPTLDLDLFLSNRRSNLLVGIKVKARENAKAVEIANKLCETFENIFSYMIADLKHQRTIGILNYRGWRSTNVVICNNNGMGFNGTNHIVLPVKIDSSFFIDESNGHDKIWKIISKSNKTEIEKRLINSIEWIGKAIHEIDLSKSLIQFVFAIEGMLQFTEKVFVTPSIVSQLCESMAFIIADDKDERIEIVKSLKEIYQKRSAISHGGSKIITLEDVYTSLHFSKLMITSFLTTKPFCEMDKMDELNKYLINLKFK